MGPDRRFGSMRGPLDWPHHERRLLKRPIAAILATSEQVVGPGLVVREFDRPGECGARTRVASMR